MEDDDDIYEPEESSPNDTSNESLEPAHAGEVKMAGRLEEGEEDDDEEGEDEEEESESDIEFIVEKKDAPVKEDSPVATFERPKATAVRITADTSAKPSTPQEAKAPLKPGSEYPAYHTSTLDINADPIHPATGKPITQTDLDVDFPENDKPWRRPGSDVTDYFNYGFDEFTWASYCLKQNSLRKEVGDQKKEMEDMQNFFSGAGGAPGMPPMPGMPAPPGGGAPGGGMGGMPGMPELSTDMMGNMMGAMMSQGLDPSTMPPEDFMRYAQQFMQMGGQGGGGGQQGFGGQMGGQGNQQPAGGYGDGGGGGGGFQGQGQGGGQQRGGRGRGRRWQ